MFCENHVTTDVIEVQVENYLIEGHLVFTASRLRLTHTSTISVSNYTNNFDFIVTTVDVCVYIYIYIYMMILSKLTG